jgi:hypothetical protein
MIGPFNPLKPAQLTVHVVPVQVTVPVTIVV